MATFELATGVGCAPARRLLRWVDLDPARDTGAKISVACDGRHKEWIEPSASLPMFASHQFRRLTSGSVIINTPKRFLCQDRSCRETSNPKRHPNPAFTLGGAAGDLQLG
jgi:hypothetical protein